MQIEDFQYLLAVAEHSSIGRAAHALGISQPALTKAIRRIEVDAGLPLFTRNAKGVVLTEAGRAFLRRGQRIWLEYQDAQKEMLQMRTGQLGLLRVGFSPTAVESVVVAACSQLLRERPAARLHLRERLISDLIELLHAGELDLILAPTSETTAQQGLLFQPLYRDSFRVICDRAHRMRARKKLSLRDLADAQWILPGPHVRVRQWISDAYQRLGVKGPDVRVQADFGRVSMWGIAQGTGLLTLCSAGSEAEAARYGLEPLRVTELDGDREIGVVTRQGAWRSPLTERLTELLQANCRR